MVGAPTFESSGSIRDRSWKDNVYAGNFAAPREGLKTTAAIASGIWSYSTVGSGESRTVKQQSSSAIVTSECCNSDQDWRNHNKMSVHDEFTFGLQRKWKVFALVLPAFAVQGPFGIGSKCHSKVSFSHSHMAVKHELNLFLPASSRNIQMQISVIPDPNRYEWTTTWRKSSGRIT